MRILTVDPGGTTGWTFSDDDKILAQGQVDDWISFCTLAEDFLDRDGLDHIVCESYVITMETVKKTRQYEPLMIIGTLFWLADKYDVPMTLQSRNTKAFSTDAKLKNLGWWVKGQQHTRDAARHLLAFLWNNQLIEAERFLDGES